MELIKRYFAQCRLPLLLLALGGLILLVFRLLCGNINFTNAWLRWVSMPWKAFFSGLVDPLPFSAAEGLCTLFAVWALGYLLTIPLCVLHGDTMAPARRLTMLAAIVVLGYAAASLLWGTQYYGTSFAKKAGLIDAPVSTESLGATTEYFAGLVNASAPKMPRGMDGVFAVSVRQIFRTADGLYDGVVAEYPCLAGPQRNPKPGFYSGLMSAAGFTGYLFPYLGESTLNVDCPAVFLPVTIAHEFSHQRGVAREQEANFCGVEACLLSGDDVYYYSGALFAYTHLSNALYKADRERWREISGGLCAQANADLAANNAYWARWESPVKTVAQKNYSNFIKSYGQTLGMASYGACVDLLVARYDPTIATN